MTSKTNPNDYDLTEDVGYCGFLGLLHCMVCVPKSWDDERVLAFVNAEAGPCGTTNGWQIAEADEGMPEVCVQCPDDPNRWHRLIDC